MSAEAELDRTKPQFSAQPIEGPDQWVTGARVGHFRLERKLGAGGMGQVWLAEQFEPIARKVAVKLIQPQFKDPLAEAFFQIERQALASLDHPNIARVYEAGSTTQGQLYLAMEWVDGMTLEEFAQARPERKLLLPLFVTVCRAVQHAHSRNIVHRDLKPQNILICEVDGSPQPKIIDFGIAAAPGLSASGGTQGYMSPEQAAGISDQRTDVYALGVVLLELLMSSRQGDLKRWKQLPPAARLRALATGAEPGSLLSFDERALLERALALAPDARISTAQLLGDEVARLLAGLGLSLLPRTPLYVLSRFVTRNWGKVSIAALVLLAMMGSLVIAAVGWEQARREARNAELASGFLASLLESVSPERAEGFDKALMLHVLGGAAQRAEQELEDAPVVFAQVSSTLAGTYGNLGEEATSLAIAKRAYERAIKELGVRHRDSLRLAYHYALGLERNGELKSHMSLVEQTYQLQSELFGADDNDALTSASVLVRELRMSGRIKRALEFGNRALAAQGADSHQGWELLAIEVAHAATVNGEHERGIELLKAVATSARQRLGAHSYDYSHARGEVGAALFAAKRYQEARVVFAEVLPVFVRVLGDEHPRTLTARGNLAAATSLTGDSKAALVLTSEVLEKRRALHGEHHPETLIALGNHAATAMRAGELELARGLFEETVALCDKLRAPNHPTCAERQAGLGKVLRDLERFPESERVLLDAFERKGKVEGQQFAPQAQVAEEIAELYRRWQRPEQAAAWRERALALKAQPN